jgi:hypothetical protein
LIRYAGFSFQLAPDNPTYRLPRSKIAKALGVPVTELLE